MVSFVEEVVQVPKEINDIRQAVVAIIGDIKAGKSAVEIAAENLANLVQAVNGMELVDDEVRGALGESVACMGLLGRDVLKAVVS